MTRRPGLRDRAVAHRQLAVMLGAGVALSRALEVLGRQGENPLYARAWEEVRRDVLRGRTLSRGMGRRSEVFPMLEVGLARAGEASGALALVFDHLATLLEREVRVQGRFRAALAYPLLALLVCLGIAFGLVHHVLPAFLNGLLRGVDDLPWMTRVLIALTDASTNPVLGGVVLGATALGVFLARRYLATPQGRYRVERLELALPVLGLLRRRQLLGRFCQALATLLPGGVPLVTALKVAGSAVDHVNLSEAVEGICVDLREGCTVAEAFEASGFFPALVTRMVAVGEEAGQLPAVLRRLAGFYEQELEMALEALTAALEPLVVGVMGLFVGFVLLALFVPLHRVLTTL